MSLRFKNLFCLQICLDSFVLKLTVRLYLFCFRLKITICLCGACVMQLPKKSKRKLVPFFLNLRSINFRLTQFSWIFYQVFYIPTK